MYSLRERLLLGFFTFVLSTAASHIYYDGRVGAAELEVADTIVPTATLGEQTLYSVGLMLAVILIVSVLGYLVMRHPARAVHRQWAPIPGKD